MTFSASDATSTSNVEVPIGPNHNARSSVPVVIKMVMYCFYTSGWLACQATVLVVSYFHFSHHSLLHPQCPMSRITKRQYTMSGYHTYGVSLNLSVGCVRGSIGLSSTLWPVGNEKAPISTLSLDSCCMPFSSTGSLKSEVVCKCAISKCSVAVAEPPCRGHLIGSFHDAWLKMSLSR